MGYQGHGSLTSIKNDIVEPLSHTQGHNTQDTIGLGFGLENDIPTFDQRLPMSSELEDDDPPIISPTSKDEELSTTNNDVEASTSQQIELDESNHEDMNRGQN